MFHSHIFGSYYIPVPLLTCPMPARGVRLFHCIRASSLAMSASVLMLIPARCYRGEALLLFPFCTPGLS